MGIVHHSNYFAWFELGRSDYCRLHGFSYQEMESVDGALMVVAEAACRFKSPAHYDDLLTVRTTATNVRSRGISFSYEIWRDSDKTLIAEGETKHIVTDRDKKVRSFPVRYRKLLEGSSGVL
jgi:acyl-CoA thioester hydrolase